MNEFMVRVFFVPFCVCEVWRFCFLFGEGGGSLPGMKRGWDGIQSFLPQRRKRKNWKGNEEEQRDKDGLKEGGGWFPFSLLILFIGWMTLLVELTRIVFHGSEGKGVRCEYLTERVQKDISGPCSYDYHIRQRGTDRPSFYAWCLNHGLFFSQGGGLLLGGNA